LQLQNSSSSSNTAPAPTTAADPFQAIQQRQPFEMQPALQTKQVEDAAIDLNSLVCSPRIERLLQRPLPARPTAAQQAALASCSDALRKLVMSLPQDFRNILDKGAMLALISSVLQHQAAYNIGVLLAWLQQQPQQLAAALQSEGMRAASVQNCWCGGMLVLQVVALMRLRATEGCTAEHNSAVLCGAGTLAANMTQQLQQTGWCT
jgi:hypothetical protein